ncbi:Ankyrin repeat-containing protein [Cynara cardunculus var. scolymus]|uniref:Ankyrin repeat-containing protein n=1 Tax=Cynara cardunculus var. scolymus TaxID=59895 RepID=A0A103XMP5_CYNCS|nr:Ankyrin repeat-containing protein [Cynara cardunculus var. scolymus]
MERVEGLLFYASVEGNVTQLQILLQEDPLILDRVTVNRSDNMPLHVASMLGHFDFVNEILSRKPQLARESDSQRRLPLHIASAKGHVEIVKALLSAHPETCLAQVNASNTNGETSMDILAQGPKNVKDRQIIRSLTRADAVEPKTEGLIEKIPQKWISKMSSDYKKLFPPISQKNREDWLDKKGNVLMVVASFIATMAFQVGTNPPSGVWQEDKLDAIPPEYAGYAVMANNHPVLHHIFLISNTVGFVSTLSIILLLISGLPFLKHRGYTWIMMVIMWIATTSMSITYYVSITVTTPVHKAETIRPLSIIIVFVWIGLMTLVVGGHILRLMAITKEDQKA